MSPNETVAFAVTKVEPIRGRGSVIAIASVDFDIGGVKMALHGVQVARRANGQLFCRLASFHHPWSKERLPAMTMPQPLREALAIEVLSHVTASNGVIHP